MRLTLGALVLAGILQVALRGPDAAQDAPSLRGVARVLTRIGFLVTILPLAALLMDVPGTRSPQDFAIMLMYLALSLALALPPWAWPWIALRRSSSRSTAAAVASVSLVNTALALVMYRGLFMGDADSQDGIVVQITPVLQLITVACAMMLRKLLDVSAPATESATASLDAMQNAEEAP